MTKAQSLDPKELEISDVWNREIARRVEEIRSGRAMGKPAEQVFAELRERWPPPPGHECPGYKGSAG